ncbi:MAG: preprotein translocase subunit SecG [Planctomycetales bacterium]|nr:preprotein translocase subunit SecG [Planctomycetales bacterium]
MLHFLLGLALTLLALFLILIILVQRGRGGGLSGALGGMGGQSAFGTKAGDAFTKITIGISIAWIVMCIVTSLVLGRGGSTLFNAGNAPPASAPAGMGTSSSTPDAGGETSNAGVSGGEATTDGASTTTSDESSPTE